MKKNNLSGIQRLIKYLKTEFLVDKGIDFILIFVGLYAALSLEHTLDPDLTLKGMICIDKDN